MSCPAAAVHVLNHALVLQMRGLWAGLPFQPPQPYNLSVPDTCRMTTVSQMSCVLSHLFAIFSAYQAGQVRS